MWVKLVWKRNTRPFYESKKGAEILIRDALGQNTGKYKQGVEDVTLLMAKISISRSISSYRSLAKN